VINEIILSLGSNIGHRLDNMQRAVDALGSIMAVEALSSVYETVPWGLTDQPKFLNSCLRGKTRFEPRVLIKKLKEIETVIGREPGERWGPRLIDIDILYFGNQVVDDDDLKIPHPQIAERAFVLAPLANVASEYQDPRSGKSVGEMLATVDQSGVIRQDDAQGTLKRPTAFAWGVKTYVMGILNITPDSFSGDGLLGSDDWINEAVSKALLFAEAGADILDIGGESTRPGSQPISPQQELERLLPVINAVRKVSDLPLSVDTYRSEVAATALQNGADWINDVWGLRMDEELANVAAEMDCPIVLMHNRSKPKNVSQEAKLGGRYVGMVYDDLIADVSTELSKSVDIATEAGIERKRIILDPGIGFGKTVSQNLQLLNELDQLKTLGFPILVGTSRKSFIGYTLGLPPEDRVDGTAATVAIAIDRGADIVRVHDVDSMVKVAGMTDSIIRK
jgi:dihydropteroate synthase/2-amino-4-hydroxy-6-hydroxymethyldihydropteridine diphosphokinase